MRAKIPPRAEPEILSRAKRGWSSDAIAVWLSGEYGTEIGPDAVEAYLREEREFQSDVVTLRAMEHVRPDMEGIADIITRGTELRELAREDGLPHLEAAALTLVRDARMFRLRIALGLGVLQPDDDRLPVDLRPKKSPPRRVQ